MKKARKSIEIEIKVQIEHADQLIAFLEKNGRAHYCDEYETPIQSLEQLENILTALDMKTVVVVDKTRKIWNFKDYEILFSTAFP